MESLREGQKIWVGEEVAILRVVPRDDGE